ncbi:hypothetical protein EDC96DRAFT_538042 [Choanephora cucurbitarum]|nr:hypothetical protein EDC96DRAFT_538042 [Choanephora cucurbitarum]
MMKFQYLFLLSIYIFWSFQFPPFFFRGSTIFKLKIFSHLFFPFSFFLSFFFQTGNYL